MFASEFRKVLKRFSDRTVFVDLFGGSGLLSHITKRERPDATVIYNDHDNYRERLENISRTNALLSDLRRLSEGIPRHRMLSKKMHGMFLERIRREESTGFVDYLTISSSLLFSGKYARNIGELGKLNFYNNMRLSDYCCEGYLDGLEVVCCDYRELVDRYRDSPDVVFLIDPPTWRRTSAHTGWTGNLRTIWMSCWYWKDTLSSISLPANPPYWISAGGWRNILKPAILSRGRHIHPHGQNELQFVLYGHHAVQGND